MAKRLSSIFSSNDRDHSPSSNSQPLNVGYGSPQTPPRGRLTKSMPRSSSDVNLQAYAQQDLQPPPMFASPSGRARSMSRDGRMSYQSDAADSRQSSSSRPHTPNLLAVPGTSSMLTQSPQTGKNVKRRSWIPGKSDKSPTEEPLKDVSPCSAWIAGLKERLPYDLDALLNGQPVEDLWDQEGDVLVHLYPEASRKGPSFRVNSQLFADSRVLSYLAQPEYPNGNQHAPVAFDPSNMLGSLSLNDKSYGQNYSRPMQGEAVDQVKSVFLPLGLEGNFTVPGTIPQGDDLELVVVYRNFFAFLCGGALVATHRQNALYSIFMSTASILKRLQYGNEKGSSWGAVPWASFSRYTDELRLADVRTSREKTIEAILLGNAMRSWPLYVEGFTHAVGKLDDIKSINLPKFQRLPPAIINKLEWAQHNLETKRLLPLRTKLDNFYFPSMFAGVANSATSTEAKLVSFKAWKAHFQDFRQYTMNVYKRRYGSWPPKAKSKKNNFEESGLNRLLIREVYKDFTDLYELLADRTSLTPRTIASSTIPDNTESGTKEATQHGLRVIESEYDRATPPVQPPIPFDVPLIPEYGRMAQANAQSGKKFKDSELTELLLGSYNRSSMRPTPWVQEFLENEYKLCSGKTIQEIVDVRCGQWLFMYAVLQALPMSVVDARDLNYTDGVEYFLCEGPRGGRPWMASDQSQSRAWFNVASGGGLVSMPADTIDHSVEGIYRRSYCWTLATQWAEASGLVSPVASYAPPMQFPPPDTLAPAHASFLAPGSTGSTSPWQSPLLQPVVPGEEDYLPRISSRSSMHLGLHEVAPPIEPAQPNSNYKKDVTFDDIFASQQIRQKPGKQKKK